MIEFMLDTNICIYLIRQKPRQVVERLEAASVSDIGISSITQSELEYGVCKSRKTEQNRAALLEFLAPLEILAYDDMAAQYYGEVRSHLEAQGTPFGSLDMLIAAHARSIGCTLVSNNTAEFSRVPDLKLDNWVV